MNINTAAIFATMTGLADSTHPDFAAIGVTKADFDKTTGDTIWTVRDRLAVLNTFKAIIYSTTDALGLDRVVLPPEFVAGAICTVIAPVNRMAAAHWVSTEIKTGKPILSDDGEEVGFSKCTVSTLLHLVTEGATLESAQPSRQRMLEKMTKK